MVTVIHPGFVKTATTSLQRRVFPNHSQIRFLGLDSGRPEIDRAIHAICREDGVYYDHERVRQTFAPHLVSRPDATVVLVSSENFTLYESKDKSLVAERLRQLFGEAKVFFTIRRQQDVLRSWYLQKLPKYVQGNNFMSFGDWLRIKRLEPHKSILDDLRYNETIEYYCGLFGRENVAVFLFEDLRVDPEAFARDLAEFVGVGGDEMHHLLSSAHDNPTIPASYYRFWKWASPITPNIGFRVVNRIGQRSFDSEGRRAAIPADGEVDSLVAALCGDGNRRLTDNFGVDLQRAGYHLSASVASPSSAHVSSSVRVEVPQTYSETI